MTFNKLLWAVFMAIVLGLQRFLVDDVMSTVDWVELVSMLLAAVGTWLVPNTPALETAKTWVNALVVGAGVVLLQLADGWQTNVDLWPIIISIAAAAGVYVMPNKSQYELAA